MIWGVPQKFSSRLTENIPDTLFISGHKHFQPNWTLAAQIPEKHLVSESSKASLLKTALKLTNAPPSSPPTFAWNDLWPTFSFFAPGK